MTARRTLLMVRPRAQRDAHGGDEVMYRKAFAALAEQWELDVLELAPVGKVAKLANMARGIPPECTRFMSAANTRAVADRLAAGAHAAAVFFNEVSLPSTGAAKRAGVPIVAVTQNVHSLVAETEPSRLARALRPLALAFERRYYADPSIRLLCISRADADALVRHGTVRGPIAIAPPGAPPEVFLAADAGVMPVAVITGSYGWWRKRRDLEAFAGGTPLGVPIHAADPEARAILGAQAEPLDDTPAFWEQGLRFGLVTDMFVGGFKLKSLEYVAKNCVVISQGDIAMEFAGLPHADEFVRIVPDKDAASAVIAELLAAEPAALLARFRTFKAACLERYAWARCLQPLELAVAKAAA